jgi:uncharacterized LabA/DUF88 family protein
MIKHKDQRVGIFVDVANMYYSAKHLYGARVNFGKILETAVEERRLVRAIAYVIKAEAPEEQSFFDALEKQGYEVKSKDLQVFAGGAKKGDWDVGISVDAIKLADRMDAIVLVTGDGDYIPLVTYLQQNKGCRVEVLGFGESASAQLRVVADEFIDLSSDTKRYLLPMRRSNILQKAADTATYPVRAIRRVAGGNPNHPRSNPPETNSSP